MLAKKTKNETVQALVRQLNGRLQQLKETSHSGAQSRISAGCEPLDRLLPGRGFARGTLVEWLSTAPGSGTSILALLAAREACREGGTLVVLDRKQMFYPPAVAAWGIDLDHTVVVRPSNNKDELWALDQTLRCRDVAAVIAWPDGLDSFTFRRLQLAVETSGGLGLLVRGATSQSEPSWADVRLLVSPVGQVSNPPRSHAAQIPATSIPATWQLSVELLRCRGRFGGEKVVLEIEEQTGVIRETASDSKNVQSIPMKQHSVR